VCPAAKSLAKIKESMKRKTDRRLTPIPLGDVVRNLNASLRGWVRYFHYRNSSKVLDKVKTYAENRLRTHLMKRHKIRNRGAALQRFPRQKLYADYGLYKVPVTAAWKSAHASV
jgi:RNA-directed DNA polymerase